ncbi:hypothetical protein [Bacillus sp. FJAT-47783]|uniref:hypothetical protein n=1 Tax=Bacillus sp. FJAT-47783 TaxID=2922712 RepID=UPI001FAD6794|nr:hypothetical protein [Bacillus sp. FJAT-47783]
MNKFKSYRHCADVGVQYGLPRRALKISKDLLLIDSTTITVGKSRLPWELYYGKRAGIKLHVGYTPFTEMPLQVVFQMFYTKSLY